MRRRRFVLGLGALMATPVTDAYSRSSGGVSAEGRLHAPAWSPVAGEIKTISHAAGAHPNGAHGGAVLSEIDSAWQSWNPNYPAPGPWGYTPPDYYFGSITAYSGLAFNSDTRQLVGYGGGHAAVCVPAPWAFDLNDLTWKWLDVPVPSDSLAAPRHHGHSPPFTQAQIELFYPAAQHNYVWGDWNGDWPGWPSGFGRPGKIFPEPGHSRGTLVHIPAASLGNAKGALLKTDAPTGSNGGTNAKSSHLFDFAASAWSRTVNQHSVTTSSGVGVIHDAHANKVLMALGGPVDVLDVPTRTWSIKTASNAFTMAVDNGTHNLHLASRIYLAMIRTDAAGNAANEYDSGGTGVRHRINAAHVDDILSGRFSWTTLRVTATTTWPLRTTGSNFTIGWAYCPLNECLYCVNGCSGSTSLWKLSPPAGAATKADYLTGVWTITEEKMTRGSLNAPGNSMVFNRLNWDAKSKSFIWTSASIGGAVQAIRPLGIS